MRGRTGMAPAGMTDAKQHARYPTFGMCCRIVCMIIGAGQDGLFCGRVWLVRGGLPGGGAGG